MQENGIISEAKRETPHVLFGLRSIQDLRTHWRAVTRPTWSNIVCCSSIWHWKPQEPHSQQLVLIVNRRQIQCGPFNWLLILIPAFQSLKPSLSYCLAWSKRFFFSKIKTFLLFQKPTEAQVGKAARGRTLRYTFWLFRECRWISINDRQQRGSSNWSDDRRQHAASCFEWLFPSESSLSTYSQSHFHHWLRLDEQPKCGCHEK